MKIVLTDIITIISVVLFARWIDSESDEANLMFSSEKFMQVLAEKKINEFKYISAVDTVGNTVEIYFGTSDDNTQISRGLPGGGDTTKEKFFLADLDSDTQLGRGLSEIEEPEDHGFKDFVDYHVRALIRGRKRCVYLQDIDLHNYNPPGNQCHYIAWKPGAPGDEFPNGHCHCYSPAY